MYNPNQYEHDKKIENDSEKASTIAQYLVKHGVLEVQESTLTGPPSAEDLLKKGLPVPENPSIGMHFYVMRVFDSPEISEAMYALGDVGCLNRESFKVIYDHTNPVAAAEKIIALENTDGTGATPQSALAFGNSNDKDYTAPTNERSPSPV